jgi:ATP-dependent DNA helicase RecG
MRPDILNPLFRPVTSLEGIGPKLGVILRRLLLGSAEDEARVVDLLFHLPVGIIDRRQMPEIAHAPQGAVVTLKLRIDRHQAGLRNNPKVPYRVFGHDETGEIALTFFHANATWLERSMPVGSTRYVSGRMEWFGGRPSMVHPDFMVAEEEFASLPLVEPVYPMTAGLPRKALQKAIASALSDVPDLGEWTDPHFVEAHGWPAFRDAIQAAHRPETESDLGPLAPPRARLAFDELFANQVALAVTRSHMRRAAGRTHHGDGRVTGPIIAALPFRLTGSQERALADITADLAASHRMLRLLQGDVGSGKTVVALLAMATVVEAGSQAALMAPTEVLARQHYETIRPLAEAGALSVALLTGRERGKERSELLEKLAHGTIDILIGTHALFQEGVVFRDLALAVVDEQHRFGVHQRLALTAKGDATDILVMTATPIPRTLVLTYFGDMDVSALTEKPPGRTPIDTRTIPLERLNEVIDRVGQAISDGKKIYWVCPLVDESEETDLAAATERAAELRERFGKAVALVHGQMKPAEKDAAMERFRTGDARVLVATTVIEVGVDVPDATIMVIEHAERFGLAQLHQLRGRIGRGTAASTCLLLYRAPLGEVAKDRLKVIRDTEDGFVIAEEDLRLRGGGEVLGTRQSGAPLFHLADPAVHADLMESARDAARLLLAADPELASARGQSVRTLLYLFSRDAAVRLLRAG